jgi:hypothetical protein
MNEQVIPGLESMDPTETAMFILGFLAELLGEGV